MYTKYIELLDEDIRTLELEKFDLNRQLEEKRRLRNHLQKKEASKQDISDVKSCSSLVPPELPFTISPNLRAVNMTRAVQTSNQSVNEQKNSPYFFPHAKAESCPTHKPMLHESSSHQSSVCPGIDITEDQLALTEGDRRSICVFGVDPTTLKAELHRLFDLYGEIDRITIMASRAMHQRPGVVMAYIRFVDTESVEKAVSSQQLFILRGKRLTVSRKRTNLPGFKRNENSAILNHLIPFHESSKPFQPTVTMSYDQPLARAFW